MTNFLNTAIKAQSARYLFSHDSEAYTVVYVYEEHFLVRHLGGGSARTGGDM
jgi:hypothetical protein